MKKIIVVLLLLSVCGTAFAWETETGPERNNEAAREIARHGI